MAKSEKKKTVTSRPKQSRKAGKLRLPQTAKPNLSQTVKPKLPYTPAASDIAVLDRLFAVVQSRRDADPALSHSARLLSRGASKVAQKFGEEAVECLIEAVAGNREALVSESADVLYHLIVLWVSCDVVPADVWSELVQREGISGIAEKAARARPAVVRRVLGTSKIP